ncbi:MAG TPA: dephospho-CoA kinase, partial [Bacteroidia bacterium]|nr:dephospho-CoA kinase [Bacteroidia bacterium]
FRGRVEAVLHPLVLQRLVRSSGDLPAAVRVFLVEVPLLYEAGFPFERNLDIVVGASATRQKSRLVNERGIPAVLAEKILDSQMPIEEKAKRADIVVWNDGSLDSFGAQTEHLARRFAPFC